MAEDIVKKEEDKKEISVQSLFNTYVDDSHRRTYAIDIPSKGVRIYTTSHTMFTTLLATEYLRRAEAVKNGGQEAHYEITPFKGLHVATHREAYKKSSQHSDYETGILYKSTLPNEKDADHQTLILSNDPQYQVDSVPYVVAGHCCTYNIHPDRGYGESIIPMLSTETCLDTGVEGPNYTAFDRDSMVKMARDFTLNLQEKINEEFIMPEVVDPYLVSNQAAATAIKTINNPPTIEE